MSTWPCSKSEAKKVGRLLMKGEPLDARAEQVLEEIFAAHQSAVEEAIERLSAVGVEFTGRAKSIETTKDKLVRLEGRYPLTELDDLAGLRCVVEDRPAQDRVVQSVLEAYRDQIPARGGVKDRRESPSAGYRAVHVIVLEGDLRVEVQVRTSLQDQWAQVTEGLGEQWGRELRYGQPIKGADLPIAPGVAFTRARLAAQCLEVADILSAYEDLHARNLSTRQRLRAPSFVRRGILQGHWLLVAQVMAGAHKLERSDRRIMREAQRMLDSLTSVMQIVKG